MGADCRASYRHIGGRSSHLSGNQTEGRTAGQPTKVYGSLGSLYPPTDDEKDSQKLISRHLLRNVCKYPGWAHCRTHRLRWRSQVNA